MANNRIQVKRTSVSGRKPNTTNISNSQYIYTGEFALNLADGILYSSDGSAILPIGANNVNVNITGNLTVNAIIANNSLGTASQYLTSNSSGGVYWSSPGAASVNSDATYTWTNTHTFTNTVYLNAVSANGTLGSAGEVLTSNGTDTYWSVVSGTGSGTVTSVASGNGLSGGPITSSGTLYVLANNGIVSNSTGVFVNANYIATLSANNTTYVNGKTESNLNVNNALTANDSSYLGGTIASGYQTTAGLASNVATLSSNNTTYLNGQLASYYTNATNITTGTLPYAQLGSAVVNTSGSFTLSGNTTLGGTNTVINSNTFINGVNTVISGDVLINNSVNAASYKVGTSFIANTSRISISGIPLYANSGVGSAGQVLTSNGSTGAPYWSTVTGGGGGGVSFSAARIYESFTSVDGQTIFSVTGGYTVDSIDVFYNGVHLSNTEYTQNGSDVVLISAANNGAIVEVSGYRISNITGSNTEIVFNDSGAFGANQYFTFDKTTSLLTIGNSSVNTQITAGNVYLNGSTLVVGNTATNVIINSTSISIAGIVVNSSVYSGTANNTTYINGKSEGNLNVNSSIYSTNSINANNADYLDGQHGSYYAPNSSLANYALLSGSTFSGDVTINANLVVTGTTVTINTATLDVIDKNITVAKGSTAAASDGAGITVDGSNIGWYYTYSSNTWTSNVGIIPSSNNSYDIGSINLRWGTIYANNVTVTNLSGNGSSITSVNAIALGGKSEGNLNVNSAVQATNTTNLNSQPGSYYTNATNITTGTLPYAQIPANVVNTTSNFTITGMLSYSNGITVSNTITANGSNGTSGYVLTSAGATGNVYWAAAAPGTNVNAQYTWTNTHTFNANVTIATTAGLKANGSVGTAGQVLASNGSSVYWLDSSTYVRQSFTGDGSTTSFTVTGGYTVNQIDVYVNGVKMAAADITISSGTSVVFGVAPPNNSVIDVIGIKAAILNFLTVNTDASYTWTNTHSFTNTVTIKAISANGGVGTSGQALISNGTSTYWGNVSSVSGSNTQIQYNDSGYSNASAGFIFTKTTNNVTISNTLFVTTAVNSASFTVGTSFVANSTAVYDSSDNLRSIPTNSQTTAYVLASSDNGKTVSTNSGVTVNGALLVANQNFTIYNNSAASITITQGTGATMYLAGTSNTGNRTLSQRGLATVLCIAANSFVISGSGLS